MAVDVKCTLNKLETAVRTAPAHKSFFRYYRQHVSKYLMTFVLIYSVLFSVRKI